MLVEAAIDCHLVLVTAAAARHLVLVVAAAANKATAPLKIEMPIASKSSAQQAVRP